MNLELEIEPFLSKQGIRILLLHHQLKSRGEYHIEDLMQRIKESSGCSNEKYSLSSFRVDIRFMKEVLEAPIFISNKGMYKYTRSFNLLPKIGLLDQDFEILENVSLASVDYKELPFFKDLSALVEKIKPKRKSSAPIVSFEASKTTVKGLEHFEDLFWAINESRLTTIHYVGFNKSESKSYVVHPHFLKEYKKRWYVHVWHPAIRAFRNFPLDRIIQLETMEENTFLKQENFDAKTTWESGIGIMLSDEPAETISFEVKNGTVYNNIDYLIGLPLHASQKASKIDATWTRFELTVYPNIELFREIRAIGLHNVRNIKPEKWKDHIMEF
jgi:predicted DNA-binding transcriptional regulator YafY